MSVSIVILNINVYDFLSIALTEGREKRKMERENATDDLEDDLEECLE